MAARHGAKLLLGLGFAWIAVFAWGGGGTDKKAPAGLKKGPDLTTAKFYGADSCADCHNKGSSTIPDPKVQLKEYGTWKLEDRHALAFAVLEGPRGQQIGRILGICTTTEAMCLNCHAMNFPQSRRGPLFHIEDGVTCDGCHGPAEHWISPHVNEYTKWRDKPPKEKEAEGMFDVRNPIKRAQICMSCHVGSPAEGKVVTHSMYAAGHPPLTSFEVASWSANLPPHWADNHDKPFKQTELAAASNRVAPSVDLDILVARAGTNLKADKAQADKTLPTWPPAWLLIHPEDDPKRVWPEFQTGKPFGLPETVAARWPEIVMTHADCYGCHHELKSDGWRRSVPVRGTPGRPQLQAWPWALFAVASEENANVSACRAKWAQLREVFAARPFGDPDKVGQAALLLRQELTGVGGLPKKLDLKKAKDWLQRLCTLPDDFYPDYDTARQIAWTFRAIYTDTWKSPAKMTEMKGIQSTLDAKKKATIDGILQTLDDKLSLTVQGSAARKPFAARREVLLKDKLTAKGTLKKVDEIRSIMGNPKNFLAPLQAINDGELQEALERVRRYDPRKFRQWMADLSRLLK